MKGTQIRSGRSRATRAVAALGLTAVTLATWHMPALAVNPIVLENQLPGNPPSEWETSGGGSPGIQGYTTDISVNHGETVYFKIKTTATAYRLDIYRMGFYGGMGARKVATVLPSATLPQSQPECVEDTTGLVDCGAWDVSASWNVPADATSGIYFAKLVREDGIPGDNHVVFVVRDDERHSDILFQTSDGTWQAYNRYGGNSLYTGNPAGRAYKVSYNRPFNTRVATPEDWVFNAEYPMVRWLERNGYDVSYFTGVDAARRGAEILEHRIYMPVGHDEYWSGEQRAHVELARDAGVHLAFFSGNEVFWKTRWEAATQGPPDPYRTMVCYKETHDDHKSDPLPDVWTGTWRDNRFSPPADGGRPENALTGNIFMVNCCTYSISVPSAFSGLRFWRNTAVASQPPGGQLTLGQSTLGYEWDEALDNGARPAGLVKMSRTTQSVPERLLDFGSNYGHGIATHSLTLYRAPSGALVFGAGTVQWSWGLDGNHDRSNTLPDASMLQATVNLLADMGVQPGTLESGLVAASASTDHTAPSSAVTSPAPGTNVSIATPVTVSGTATDAGGGVVGGVEISFDGGTAWRLANGTTSWSYSWTPNALGSVTIRTRAVDDSGNLEPSGQGNTIQVVPAQAPDQGPGGPILVVGTSSNLFSSYFAEILHTEGLNEFAVTDLSGVTPSILAAYDCVILGEMPLTAAQVMMFTNWVNAGGNLIAMRPDAQLASLLGLTSAGGTLANGYIQVSTGPGPGAGIVGQTIQFHGSADLYSPNGATSIATLYSNPTTATASPAVTLRSVGVNGGQAASFTYDLARSVVYTRQGNPGWAGQERDGITPIRPDDLFYGAKTSDPQPDWVNLDKVAIPQADEQQRLLTNLILSMTLDRKPLPRLWYFPKGKKAVIIMTGDDHNHGGTADRFDHYDAVSPPGCSADDWDCIRATSYIFPETPIPDAQMAAFDAKRFEISLHLLTNCDNWTASSLDDAFTTQLAQMATNYPSLPPSSTNRTHCIVWSEWSTEADVEVAHGIRLDTDYYYWPSAWIQNRPGMFTGSGMPMRFAALDGRMIDCYQATTQMTDESNQTYPFTVNNLLDKAIGPEGYYGAFCANMHTDFGFSAPGDAIVQSAQARGVPVVSSRQMLQWLDGRNATSFQALAWNGSALTFTLSVGGGARNLRAMLPYLGPNGPLQSLTREGSPVAYTTETIKGVAYAIFTGDPGHYAATYQADTSPPVISSVSAAVNVDRTAHVTWSTSEASNSRVDYGTSPGSLGSQVSAAALVTSHDLLLTGLGPGTTYYYRVTSADLTGNSGTSPVPPSAPLQFATPIVCFSDVNATDFAAGTLGPGLVVSETGDGEIILAPAASAEFSGTALPAGWTSTLWAPGGIASVFGGRLALDAARAGTAATFMPDRSLEFVATFSGDASQHVGFGVTYDGPPWAMFSTMGGGGLFARSHDGTTSTDTPLDPGLLGSPHRFRIDWTGGGAVFSVDGVLVATHVATITDGLRPLASDFNAGGGTLSVDWMRLSPYADFDVYLSRVFGGSGLTSWGQIGWASEKPSGTSLGIAVRSGNTPVPDGSWSGFTNIPGPGGAIGASSRYLQYRASLGTSDARSTPALENVGIACTSLGDPFPPVISGVTATPNAAGTQAHVTWLTDEPATSHVDYGTSAATLGSSVSDNAPLSSHDLTLTGLTPNVTYYYRVTSVDGVGNSATNPAPPAQPRSFITPYPDCFTDQLAADFEAGTLTGTYVGRGVDGEVILAPTEASEFEGTQLPAGWFSAPWEGGGSAVVTAGALLVDGASAGTNATYAAGRTLEFTATFQALPYQHLGFGVNFNDPGWAIFSTGSAGTQMQARTWDGGPMSDVNLPGVSLGAPHHFRIDWKPASVDFYVDGVLASSHAVTLPMAMRVLASDATVGGTPLAVDRMVLTPYQSPGTFTSRVFDSGVNTLWGTASWTADTPAGTTLGVDVRHGNTAAPDPSWTPFAAVPFSGAALSGASRYFQYRTTLTSTDPAATPTLHAVQIACETCPDVTPPAAIADLHGAPVRTGNGTGAITKIMLTWSGEESGATAQVYRKAFGDYPLYRSGVGADPPAPASPDDAAAQGWTLTGVTASGQTDVPPTRDFWYYVVFAQDHCRNTSAVSNRTGGTLDYLLGDVSNGAAACTGDNKVNGLDISLLGAHYGATVAPDGPLACADVGPTTDYSVDSRPVPDGVLNFEELVLYAINFDSPPGPAVMTAGHATQAAAEKNDVTLSVPELPAVGETFAVGVQLSSTGDVQAMSIELAYDASVVEPLGCDAGALLERQAAACPMFTPKPASMDVALLGHGLGFVGEGEVGRVRFRVKAAGAAGIGIAHLQLRGTNGKPIVLGSRHTAVAPAIPARTYLAASYPNPFTQGLTVHFGLHTGSRVHLALFDIQGRLVRRIIDGDRPAGEYTLTWDGRNEGGGAVASGIYLVRLTAGGHQFSHRVLRMH